MTSASIMEMSKTGFATGTTVTKSNAATVDVQFSDAMEFASAGQKDEGAGTVRGHEVDVHTQKSAAEQTGRKEIREAGDTASVEEKDDVSGQQVSEELEAKEEAIVKEIAEELGVSEEQVREAMEVLGLSVMDLLTQGNMVALTAQLTGMQTVDVLTDENLFAQITELTRNVQTQLQTLADELGMSPEQLQAMIDEQMAAGEQVQVSGEQQMPVQEFVTDVATEAEPAAMEEDAIETLAVVDADNGSEEVQTETKSTQDGVSIESVKTEKNTSENSAKEENGSAFMNGNQMVQQPAGADVGMTSETVADELFAGRFDAEQARDMIHQISDYVRLHRTQQITSMEIQLHPVELGTVNLQVVAKDGNITAQLTVQDDAVRAAMESQVMQLKESLQQQGLKIEAVEVTVATHEFEQNLDQHGKDAQEEAAREKKGRRKILDLNELDQVGTEETEMSDADRLQVEMMRMGGNRLNFRV